MENRLKLKLSRIFRNSFGSCRTGIKPDVIKKSTFSPEINPSFHVMNKPSNLPPKARLFPSICKPNRSEPSNSINNNSILSSTDLTTLPRPKISGKISPFIKSKTCPPASPVFSPNLFYEIRYNNSSRLRNKKTFRSKKKNRSKTKTTQMNICKNGEFLSFNSTSQDSFHGSWWSSSDNEEREEETETLFSSKSFSSDSSERRRRRHICRGKKKGNRRRSKLRSEIGLIPLKEGQVKDSFAIVKKSSDPYNDFRTSMVEMIIEKQIFEANDLEKLLHCFLSLNCHRHHRVIIEAFMEIWDALFCNWKC